jgi:hypothetical protein
MVGILCASEGPLFGTPADAGKRPVRIEDRAGAQTGAFEYQLRNVSPRWARASICGSLQVGGAEVPEVVASEIVEHHPQNIRTILGGRAPQEW